MNTQKTIQILVKPDGSVAIQTKGFAGQACRQATQALEKALGEVASEQTTAEFYQTQQARQDNRTQT